ncbi:MAG: nuclear transport factor 2 family protein [Leifsonia sp.]
MAQLTPEEIARAFSGHDFAAAIEYLADDVVWDLVGDDPIVGRAAVEEACRASGEYLATATTVFDEFRSIVGASTVVIDSRATYTDADGDRSVVASCDLYDFSAGRITAIRSYNLELEGAP